MSERVRLQDVLRVAQRPKLESLLRNAFRDSGFSAPAWSDETKGGVARVRLAESLTRVEDVLELKHPKWPERDQLRDLRRRLELELWR